MIHKTKKHIQRTFWSMKNATRGIKFALKSERNLRIELVIIAIVIIYAFYLNLNYLEFAIVFIASFSVIGAELLNTAIEETWNKLHPDHHEHVGKIKDLASGGVLLIGIGAVLAGLCIFSRHIFT